MGDFVKYATPNAPTLDELLAKRDAGLNLFGWEKALIWSITIRRTLLNRSPVCKYCRIELTDLTATIDHIHPRALGGEDVDTNAALACKSCNMWKGHLTLEQFRRSSYYRWIKGMQTECPSRPKNRNDRWRRKTPNYVNFQILWFTRAPLC